jgi:hypothetical protein
MLMMNNEISGIYVMFPHVSECFRGGNMAKPTAARI